MQIDDYPMTVERAGAPTLWVPCHTGVRAGISAKNVGEDADVEESLVANGCHVSGRVRRAVLGGLGANYFRESEAWRQRIAAAMETDDAETLSDPVERRFRKFAAQKGKDRLALAACMRSPRHKYETAELKRSKRPVLVVCGADDDLTGSPEPLAEAFADGRAVTLPGKDHMSAVGDPAYKKAVLQFLG